jgi:enoyl-CoA hydratase
MGWQLTRYCAVNAADEKSVRYGIQMELRTAFRFEVEAYDLLVDTEDRREGVAAFNEKHQPVFTGR